MSPDPLQPPAARREAVVQRRERVYAGFLNVDELHVRHTRYDGGMQEVQRLSVESRDSVAVLPLDRTRRLVWLAEQLRVPTLAAGPGWLREIPAGRIDDGESPEAAGARECFEETGLQPRMLEPMACVYASPGSSTERIHLFLGLVDAAARDEAAARRARDAGEDIALVERPLDAFLDDCRAGRVDDAKTLVAGLWLLAHRVRLGL